MPVIRMNVVRVMRNVLIAGQLCIDMLSYAIDRLSYAKTCCLECVYSLT